MDDDVQEYRALFSNCSELVHSGDYVKLHPPFYEVNYFVEYTVFYVMNSNIVCLILVHMVSNNQTQVGWFVPFA